MNPQLETLKNWKGWSDGEVRRLAELVDTERTDLIAKLERCEKALAFYSDPKRWEQCHAVGNVCDSIEDGDPMMVFLDGEDHPWSVADEALKGDKP